MKPLLVPRDRSTDQWSPTKLSWRPLKTPDGPSATLTCSKGHYGTLLDHEIAADGTVTPSVVCTEGGCDFHAYVRLEGWPA